MDAQVRRKSGYGHGCGGGADAGIYDRWKMEGRTPTSKDI